MLLGKFVRNSLGFWDGSLNGLVVGQNVVGVFCPAETRNLAENLVESHS